MGPKGLMMVRRVCEVDLKIWCRFYPVLRDEIGAFFVGGVGCMDFLGFCFIMIFLH